MTKIEQQMLGQVDGGRALVLMALLSTFLEFAIQNRMVLLSKTMKGRLFGDGAPLFNLGAKIDMAFALGVITEETRAELHKLRKIRNAFAHPEGMECSYASPHISALCHKLNAMASCDGKCEEACIRTADRALEELRAQLDKPPLYVERGPLLSGLLGIDIKAPE